MIMSKGNFILIKMRNFKIILKFFIMKFHAFLNIKKQQKTMKKF